MTLYGYRCRDCGTHCNTLDPIRDVRCGECENRHQQTGKSGTMRISDSPSIILNNSDCISGMAALPPASVDLVVTSIPFEELFTYSGKPEDVGNNGSTVDIREGRFALNMRFVVEQMFRVLRPGSNACIHIQQLLAYKVQHGFMGRRDFRGAMVDVFTRGGEVATHATVTDPDTGIEHALPIVLPPVSASHEGFHFVGEFVIPKNPQAMSQRLNLHSLQFKTGYARDSSMLAPAVNDYVLIFRKPGVHPSPPHAVSYRHKNPRGWVTEEEWIKWASGIWDDVLEIDVLDGARGHKEEKQEKHVCPLQLEVIRRCVALYTNPVELQPDVTVLDPFMGIGSTAFVCAGGASPVTRQALAEPRNVIGFELKESYHRASVAYVEKVLRERERGQAADLFTNIIKAEAA